MAKAETKATKTKVKKAEVIKYKISPSTHEVETDKLYQLVLTNLHVYGSDIKLGGKLTLIQN